MSSAVAAEAFVRARPKVGTNPEAAKVEEYGALDVLRFVLAFAVLLYHIGVVKSDDAGNLAVQVFFALSGWLIGAILCNTRPRELSRFYFNRATRIWIPYFATVTALYLAMLAMQHPVPAGWGRFLTYDVTFTHNWFSLRPDAAIALEQMPLHGTGNHFWSIAVEEQFYLVAPLVVTLLPFGRKVMTWALIFAAALIAGTQYAAVSLGVLAAVTVNAHPGFHLKALSRSALILAAVASATIMLTVPANYQYAAPFFSVAVVLLCSVPTERSGAIRWIGGISFPLYLNTWMGVFAFHAVAKHIHIPSGWISDAGEATLAVAAAIALYHLIDRNVLANRNRYYSARMGWAIAGFAYALVAIGALYGLHQN